MFNELTSQLVRAKEQLRRKRKIDAMLAEAQQLLREEERKQAQYRRRLGDERADVEKLEGFTLTAIFYTVLGSKEEQLEKERQEYLAAKLKHDEAIEACEDLRRDVEVHQTELAEFTDAEPEYERLIQEKQRLLADTGDQRAAQLLEFAERLGDLQADRSELQEAVQAGEAAQDSLESTKAELRSASNWGTWDMLGGGVLSTYIKHSRIDDARRQAHIAQQHLHRFSEELADAGNRLKVTLDIGGFSTFADYFFDGLIVDWVVQSGIDEATKACTSAISQVSAALSTCRQRLCEVQEQAEQVNRQRKKFVEKA